jgi:transglutaminase-like putative cysteine protease
MVMRILRACVVPLVLVALIGLSGVVLGRIYADSLLTQLVIGAAVLSVGIGAAVRRLPSWSAAPTSVLVLTAYVIGVLKLAADRAELAGPLVTIVTDALRNGIPRLLTAMIPVEATPDTVVVPVIAAWLAGLAGHELATRAGGHVLLGCLPAAALYGGALYVVGPNADTAGWPTVLFAALVVAALAVTARPPSGPSLDGVNPRTRAAVRARALTTSALGLVVLVGLVAAVGPWISAMVNTTPVDPRKYVEPPQVDSLDESPLNRISGWMLTPRQELLTVGPTGTRKGTTRLRLAVLSDYDGITWRVGATYRNAGRVLPTSAPDSPDSPITTASQSVTVRGLTGRLLPVVPTPGTIEGTRIAYDPATGTVIRPEGLAPGVEYTVTSRIQEQDLNLLPTAETPTGDEVARYLAVAPNVPEEITRLADQLADGNGASYDRAAAIEDFLAEHYRKVADAPSGHAYPNLGYFLFGKRDQGGQRGTSEQFAAAFALLARLTGLPSRVVVGFDAPRAGGQVTGGDAIAWPEVLFDGLGWVPFDPMPRSDEITPVEQDFTPKPTTPPPTSDPPQASEEPSASVAPSAPAAPPQAAGGGPSTVVLAGGGSGAALLVLVAAALTLVAQRRSLSRQRLTTGGPDERISGAWLEFTDALRLSGRPVPAHLAATEAAAYAAAPPPPSRRRVVRDRVVRGRRVQGRRVQGRRGGTEQAEAESRRGRGGSSAGTPADAEAGAGDPAASGSDSGSGSASASVSVSVSVSVSGSDSASVSGSESASAEELWGPSAGAVGVTVRAAAPAPALTSGSASGSGSGSGSGNGAGLPPLDALVTAVNTVAFAPGAADDGQAARAGRQVVAYSQALRAKQSWWRRAWWSVRPGPLRWHREDRLPPG